MIFTLTLNPAIDKTVEIPDFRPGAVNRITSVRRDVGGKGINVSKCLKQLDCDSTAVAFLGGGTGAWAAEQLQQAGIPVLAVEIPEETRTNLKVIDPVRSENTDINEPGPVITAEQLAALLHRLDAEIKAGDLLILSGSIPGGVSPGIYGELTARFKARGVTVYLDADGESFRQGIAAAPALVKPNLEELHRLTGRELKNHAEILEAASELLKLGISEAVVSLGEDGALFLEQGHCCRAMGLRVPVRSTVGAGDSMVAALACGSVKGLSREQRIRLAIAISAASVMCSGTQPPERDVIEKLYHQVTIEEVY